METVGFTEMAHGTEADYLLLRDHEMAHIRDLPERVLTSLELEKGSIAGYQVTRYEHSLQTATRAARAGESEEYQVAALLHDIGDWLAPDYHGVVAAAILTPYLSDELVWVVRHHGLFQAYYYAHFYGMDRNARDKYRDHPYFDACARFCQEYDQTSFDPAYPSEPLSYFEPVVSRVLDLKRRREDYNYVL
jgi:predicted HD phosphohydrolase